MAVSRLCTYLIMLLSLIELIERSASAGQEIKGWKCCVAGFQILATHNTSLQDRCGCLESPASCPVGIDHPYGNHGLGRDARWSYFITRNERWVAPGVSSVRMCSRWIGDGPR